MEVKQEQNNFLDEDCKIKIENINLSHDGLYHSVKLEVKDELSPADSPNTNTINYCGDGYSSDKLKVETIVKDIKLEETEAEPQQTENDLKLANLFLTVLATSASVDSSFSAMKRIKMCQRNTQIARLNVLIFFNFH
uniref:Uncharacterized protein LOC114338711 isoform X4 n=1 Tax=Diabrotica virgifera virgifera TaxID=50390 RepID=A0A6P7GIT3_DIAVI